MQASGSRSPESFAFGGAGGALTHPTCLAAIALLALNDHVLKARFPGALTGKLSDFAGLYFFPLLLVSFVELAQAARGRFHAPSRALGFVCIALTGLVFAWVKTTPSGLATYAHGLAFLRWPFLAALAALRGDPPVAPQPVDLIADPTDLVALVSLAGTSVLVVKRSRAAPVDSIG